MIAIPHQAAANTHCQPQTTVLRSTTQFPAARVSTSCDQGADGRGGTCRRARWASRCSAHFCWCVLDYCSVPPGLSGLYSPGSTGRPKSVEDWMRSGRRFIPFGDNKGGVRAAVFYRPKWAYT